MTAVDRRHRWTARLLFQREAYVNAVGRTGYTALQYACVVNDTGLKNLLVERGANVTAAGAGKTSAVELLLERGAKTDIKDHAGKTAYDRASDAGRQGITQLLPPPSG